MDDAQDGVILIAFGSTIPLDKLSTEQLHMFYAMMRKFSTVRFIWRWTGDSPKEAPTNLLAADWLPQKEILSKTEFTTASLMLTRSLIESNVFLQITPRFSPL